MAEPITVDAVAPAGNDKLASPNSLGAYQRWLLENGHMPVGQILTQHPSQIAADTANQAERLSSRWDRFLARSNELMSPERLENATKSLREPEHPGPARAVIPSEGQGISRDSSGSANDEPTSALAVAEQASAAVREASAQAIEQQWQQTVALLEHDLSMKILTAAIESSISASKEVNDGLDTILRS